MPAITTIFRVCINCFAEPRWAMMQRLIAGQENMWYIFWVTLRWVSVCSVKHWKRIRPMRLRGEVWLICTTTWVVTKRHWML